MSATDKAPLDSRAKVIVAACEMLGEDAGARLSVRAVAARAGVSMGSLRHHFPTQRALRATVLETIYAVVTSDDQVIHDRSVPARDRLVQCLRLTLAPGVGAPSRQAWRTVFEAFIAREPDEHARENYLAMSAEGQRRLEYWLTVLAEEGALPADDVARCTRFLSTVLNGLALDRALPAEETILRTETESLYLAVDAVLRETVAPQGNRAARD
ncbi:helix-turn-helix domain-containing protein [Nocardia sp. NPDC050712]|uniref:helix-turn-helix domain-containing protein n=1 Tax=Nocardia sp. NPDC050712 TaxID=3155518 RepID=UPI0033FBED2E